MSHEATLPDAVDEFVDRIMRQVHERQCEPSATYRLKFHAGWTFRDAAAIVPYLYELGISHDYASPYMRARAGSEHGDR